MTVTFVIPTQYLPYIADFIEMEYGSTVNDLLKGKQLSQLMKDYPSTKKEISFLASAKEIYFSSLGQMKLREALFLAKGATQIEIDWIDFIT